MFRCGIENSFGRAAMRHVLIAIIRLYQLTLSRLVGPCCRFYPSCSCYGMEALRRHGALKGAWLGLVRLCKCHPFHPGGVDFVPEVWPGGRDGGSSGSLRAKTPLGK